MDEKQQLQVSLFRFGVISDIVSGARLERGELERLIKEKSKRRWNIPFSNRTRLSQSTIRRWIRLYEAGGGKLDSLAPKPRSDRGKSRSIDEETALSLVRLRQEMPAVSARILIEEMEARGLVTPGVVLKPSTVYRLLKQKCGSVRSPKVDRRRFEAELPNDIWQSDVMHGPSVITDGKKRKTYLIAFLDDHSRLVPNGEFYLSERLECYLDALRCALVTRGLPRKLYVDNGAAFRSRHLEHITASLGIALVHSRPYVPQGRGKVERFFRTVRTQFLPGFRGESIEDLNLAFDAWLNNDYHVRSHSSTGENPIDRFARHVELLRTAPQDLEDHFRKRARRRVTKDRTISLEGRHYEAPVPLIGEQVDLLYHPHRPEKIEILHRQTSYGFLRPVDLHVNSRIRRQGKEDAKETGYRGGRLSFREVKS
jgi:transposase InsO family protein